MLWLVAARTAAGCLLLLLSACGGSEDVRGDGESLLRLPRRGSFGSLRDFVLYHDPQDLPGSALLVDRFEVTQDDWDEFASAVAGRSVDARIGGAGGGGALPASGMDLTQARAFARWRLGRLPTEDEWRRATVGSGSGAFPWGVKEFATHANTGDLGLGELTPVGTFESGRRAGGNTPYDLIGNVREWTETVPLSWCESANQAVGSTFLRHRRRVLAAPCLTSWSTFGLLPPAMIAAMADGDAPYKVVGVDYETPMRDVFEHREDTQLASERRQRTGLRVYSTVDELLGRLLGIGVPPNAEEQRQVLRFVSRAGHREVLVAAFRASPLSQAEFPAGTVAALLAGELRRVVVEPK